MDAVQYMLLQVHFLNLNILKHLLVFVVSFLARRERLRNINQ